MIKFLDVSGSINYCLCTFELYSNVFLLGDKIRINVFELKKMICSP